MSQAEIDAFVVSAWNGTLTPEYVTMAVARGIPVNGRDSDDGSTALHWAVRLRHRELVVALLAAGANARIKDDDDDTPLCVGIFSSTADILELLINGGGSVNELYQNGDTPLIAFVRWSYFCGKSRLRVLLACPELDLDARSDGKTAEEWAIHEGRSKIAAAIAAEVSWLLQICLFKWHYTHMRIFGYI
jgi:ankyrin repeat protein